MLARKCDFCGKFYEHYDGDKHNEANSNAFIFIDKDTKEKYWTRDTYDLCPRCMEKLLNFKKKIKEAEE